MIGLEVALDPRQLVTRREFLVHAAGLAMLMLPRATGSAARAAPARRGVDLFLCGDVMTGRGIDQLMPRSCEPTLFRIAHGRCRWYSGAQFRYTGF